jgi:hypothetical protein
MRDVGSKSTENQSVTRVQKSVVLRYRVAEKEKPDGVRVVASDEVSTTS